MLLYTAREPEAEALLKAGLAKPVGRPGKKIRCLMLSCSRKAAWTFLRGGRWSASQASKTFTVARVGAQRSPVYEHLPRAFGFGGSDSLPIVTRPGEPEPPEPKSDEAPAEPEPEPITCEQLPAVDNSCAQPEIEIAVHPKERGSDAEKGGEGVTTPADLETPKSLEASDEPEDTTPDVGDSIDDNSPRDGLRMLALSVIQLAAKEDRSWFFASRSQEIFKFWAEVAQVNSGWVQRVLAADAELLTCPGLSLRGRVWMLDIHHGGKRARVRIGRDLDRAEAVRRGLEQREAIKRSQEPREATD